MIFNNSKYNADWPIKKLKELGEFGRGKSKHRPRNDKRLFENGVYPLIQTGDVKSSNLYIETHTANYNEFGLKQSKLWPANTLCITIAANIAETALLKYPMCFPDSIVGFNANENECTEVFMHYIFTYIKQAIQSRIQGSIQDNINIEYLTGLNFRIPPKREREEVESLLFSIDSKIELNNRINKELEAMAKLIYDYWFVQFDFPISKEQAVAMGKPELEGKPYKASGGKMVYNKELKREIPEGWEVKELKEFSEIKKGTLITEKTADLEGDYKVVSAGINYSYKHSSFNREKNTISISASGANAGYVNFWRERIFACDCTTVRGINDSITFMILEFLRMRQEYINQQARGSAQPHVYPKDIESLKIEIPSSRLVEKYGDVVIPMNEKMSVNELENQKLSALRDWLLPMLMNGQVTIKEAEECVNESELNMAAEKKEGYGE